MKITVEFDPNNIKLNDRVITEFHWYSFYSRLNELKTWLNFFGFTVTSGRLNEDLSYAIQTEKAVPSHILESMIKDTLALKLVSIEEEEDDTVWRE